MPPSRGHVTKRKVASPKPDPDPVDDAEKEKSRRVRDPTQMPAMVTRRVPSAQPRRLVWILMLSSKSTSRPSKL